MSSTKQTTQPTAAKGYNPWLIIIGLLGCNQLLILVANCNGLFLTPVMEQFGWSRTAASLYMTLYSWVGALIQPIVGKAFAKFDLRKLLSIVVVAFSVIYLWSGTFTELWQWNVFGVLYGICMGFFMYMPGPILINRWFKKSVGFAMSLAGVISGVIGVFFSPVVQMFIDSQGWSVTRYILGGLMLVICLPLTFIFVRDNPQKEHAKPWGADEIVEESASSDAQSADQSVGGATLSQARRMPAMYMCLLFVFLLTVVCCFVQQMPSYAAAFPIGAVAGGIALSLFNGIGIPRGPVMGWVLDKAGTQAGNMISMVICVVGSALILIGGGSSAVLFYLGVVCWSFAFVPLTVGVPMMVSDVFGSKDYSNIYSWMTTSQLVASGLAPLIYGQVYDRSGSYASYPIFVLVVSIITTALIPLFYMSGRAAMKRIKASTAQTVA